MNIPFSNLDRARMLTFGLLALTTIAVALGTRSGIFSEVLENATSGGEGSNDNDPEETNDGETAENSEDDIRRQILENWTGASAAEIDQELESIKDREPQTTDPDDQEFDRILKEELEKMRGNRGN